MNQEMKKMLTFVTPKTRPVPAPEPAPGLTHRQLS